MHPPDGTRLCRRDDLNVPGARGFVFGTGAAAFDLVVVRGRDGAVRAYVNACPHQGAPLETFPDRFLNAAGTLLVCSTHGARFRVADGHCVSGPCRGEGLTPVPVHVDGDGVVRLGPEAA